MRRLLTVLATVAMMMGVLAVPAVADEAEVFTDTVTFEAGNPCSGELHIVTINFLISVHDHEDEVLVRLRRTGETSDGFIMEHGKETISEGGGVFSAQFRDPWNNPDTGEKFEAAGRFLEVDGEVIVDDFRLACVSGPTILP